MERILHHPTRVNIEPGGYGGGGAGILLSMIMCLRWCRIVSINRKGNGPSTNSHMDPHGSPVGFKLALWLQPWQALRGEGTPGKHLGWRQDRLFTQLAEVDRFHGQGHFPHLRLIKLLRLGGPSHFSKGPWDCFRAGALPEIEQSPHIFATLGLNIIVPGF